MQIVDDLSHPRHRRRLTASGLSLRLIVDCTSERDHAVVGLHGELLAGESGILAELALNLTGNLGVVGLVPARDAQLQGNGKQTRKQ